MQFKGLLCVWTWEGCWACDHHVTWWRTESGRPGWLATRKSQAAVSDFFQLSSVGNLLSMHSAGCDPRCLCPLLLDCP
eukprot:scaffold135810_cov11-Tisochrysis_lutea.AAC.1